MALRGSCRCGGVRFEIDGPLMGVGHCHCTTCRKTQGAAFRTRARVRRSDFRWVAGEELLQSSQSTPGFHRGFCGRCGSPVVNWNTADSEYGRRNPATLETYGIALADWDWPLPRVSDSPIALGCVATQFTRVGDTEQIVVFATI